MHPGVLTFLSSSRTFWIRPGVRTYAYESIQRAHPRELVKSIRQGNVPYILDVRPVEEFKKVHIAGALSYPLETIDEKAKKLDKSRQVWIHEDQSSHLEPEAGKEATAALRAADKLNKLGFSFVKVVEGNLDDLKNAGFLHYKP